MLLAPWFERDGLRGARCAVLGPPDGVRYAELAGGEIVPPDADFDVLVIADETGFPFLDHMDAVLTTLFRCIDAGRPPRLACRTRTSSTRMASTPSASRPGASR